MSMRDGLRWRTGVSVAVALLLTTGTAFAALDKCQKRLEGEAAKLQKSMYTALQNCKDAIQKERVKGIAKGLGTNCQTGGGCMASAAAYCEKQLQGVYDVAGTKVPPGSSKVAKLRAALTKARTASALGVKECADADLDITTGMGHLLSGSTSHSAAPPIAGDAGKFLIDWHLFAIEKVVIKQQLFQVPEMLNLLQEAVQAKPGGKCSGGSNPGAVCASGTDCVGGGVCTVSAAAKKGTSCSNVPPEFDATMEEYRPNLCRFGVECRDHACTLDTSGTCALSLAACDPLAPTCAGGPFDVCVPTQSYLSLESAPLDYSLALGPVRIALGGRLLTEICRPGRTSGTCKTCPGGPATCACAEDGDCQGANSPPCNLFPGAGAGAAFGSEPNIIYLINEPSRSLVLPQPPIPIAPFNTLVDSACLEIVRSEGWCDCGGGNSQIDSTACQDHITSNNAGTDDCGSPIANGSSDSLYAGTKSGALTISTGGTSAAGDCVDLLTVTAKLLFSAADRGPDGLPCTDDDFVAPVASLAVPGTTGIANAIIHDAVDSVGGCTVGGNPCIENANCDPANGGPGGTCSGAITQPSFSQGSATGSKTSCANYQASNLSGLAFVGGAPLLNGPSLLGDLTIHVRLKCQ